MGTLDRVDALAVTRAVLAGLPDETRAALANVEVFVRDEVTDVDRARGVTEHHRGYFWGVAPEPLISTELPDDTPATGEIVIFTRGVSEAEIVRTIQHEIAHVTGHSEEDICGEMGLAP
jgi:predicted Zn-dependent protease with MMP-like domain